MGAEERVWPRLVRTGPHLSWGFHLSTGPPKTSGVTCAAEKCCRQCPSRIRSMHHSKSIPFRDPRCRFRRPLQQNSLIREKPQSHLEERLRIASGCVPGRTLRKRRGCFKGQKGRKTRKMEKNNPVVRNHSLQNTASASQAGLPTINAEIEFLRSTNVIKT